MGSPRKKLTTLLKIIFSILLLYFVFTKIPFREVWETARTAQPFYILFALLLFAFSKYLAAVRLNMYFHQMDLPLAFKSNLELYILGMFYNLFLPGGIGGDAYKGYVLHKKFQKPVKKLVGVLFMDRLSGLYLLFILSCCLLFFMDFDPVADYRWLVLIVLMLSFAVYWYFNNRFFKYLMPVFFRAMIYSAGVQISQLIAVFLILKSLGITIGTLPYLLIFLVSSMVAVLPVTIGGIGSRELVFYYGAQWMNLQEGTAISISMIFFLLSALVSFAGIYFHFRKPELVLRSQVN